MPKTHYRKYSSCLKLQYTSGGLPKTTSKQIPRSTRFYWKQLQPDNYWIPDSCSIYDVQNPQNLQLLIQNRQLRQYVRLLLYLVSMYRTLMAGLPITRIHILPVRKHIKCMLAYMATMGNGERLWKLMPLTKKQWQAWEGAKTCKNSTLLLCRKQHPQQMGSTEQDTIKETCGKKEYEHWPLRSIYAQMMRENKLHCSISTFYKYCRLLNITRKPLRKNAKYTPLLASKPLQVLHLDTTIYKTINNVKHYLYVVRDNFSRAILACKASLQYNSEQARNTLEEVLVKYNLLDKEGTLITDGGPENKGSLTDMLAKPGMLWKKLVAQVDIIQSNSMVEAANKILKYQYLLIQNIAGTEALENILPAALNDYNNRPQYLLTCYTPNEVLEGAVPDKHRFKQAIAEAKKQRTEANRKVACNNTC